MSYRSNFVDLLLAKQLHDTEAIHEASLGRIMQHAEQAEDVGFAILTSWRQDLNKKQNIEQFNELKSDLRSAGLGFNVLTGHWRECQDPTVPYEDCPEEDLVDAVEPSLFVTHIDLGMAHELGNRWGQDAVVYAGPETNGTVNLIFRDGSTMDIGEFTPMSISQAYSELRNGRTFKFEYLEWPTQGRVEALMEQTFRKKPLKIILGDVR